jgi:transposase-like protein
MGKRKTKIKLEEEQQDRVLNQLRWIFSEKSAKEVLGWYMR